MFTFLVITTVLSLAGLVFFLITSYQNRQEKAFYSELTKNDHLYDYDYDESGYLVYKRVESLLIN